MSKRRRIVDKYYQEWHIKRDQTTANTDEEWAIEIPRPLEAPPSGTYWAIEIHSIIARVNIEVALDASAKNQDWALTTTPRWGKVPFITECGDPENLWYRSILTCIPVLGGAFINQDRLHDKAAYTDNKGQGKLVIGDHIWLQVSSSDFAAATRIQIAIEYTFTTVSCGEYVQELVSQLGET